MKVAVERVIQIRAWVLERAHYANHGEYSWERALSRVGRIERDMEDRGTIDDRMDGVEVVCG